MKKIFLFMLLAIGLITASTILSSCSSDEQEKTSAEAGTEETQLWTCGMHPEVILEEPGQCPKCGMNLTPVKTTSGQASNTSADSKTATADKGKILYWQAPMNPSEIYDHPGKSAMGMDLVPVYEGDSKSSAGSITIDPVTVQNMGVRIAPVERIDFSSKIRTIGNIDYDETKLYVVTTKISGWIEKLYVDYTGQEVKKGQPLLEIYSPDLVTTQEEYLLALKNRKLVSDSKFSSIIEGAESLLKSSRKRLEYWDIPASAIEHLEKTGEVKKTITLVAPANGVVTHKNAVEGMKIMAGASLYKIADLSTVWAYASIYDNEVPWVHENQRAEMDLSYNPGKTYEGRVAYIYPYLNDKARDVRLRLEFPNPDLDLRPGMYANVTLESHTIKDAIIVPVEAVIRSGSRNLVFIAKDGGRFEPREVTIGEEGEGGKIRILNGLLGGEKVVISAQFLLDSESRLQEAIQKMLQEKRDKKSGNEKNTDMKNMQHDEKANAAMDHSKMNMDHEQDGDMKMDHSKMDMEHKQSSDMDHSKMDMNHEHNSEMKMDHENKNMKH